MPDKIKRDFEEYWGGEFANELKRRCLVHEITLLEKGPDDDPPDARYEVTDKAGKKYRAWLEITGVYLSNEYAEEAWESARGHSVPTGNPRNLEWNSDSNEQTKRGILRRMAIQSDCTIAKGARLEICKKLKKTNYENLRTTDGPGYLLLVVPSDAYPLFEHLTVTEIQSRLPVAKLNSQDFFKSVWVAGSRYGIEPLWPFPQSRKTEDNPNDDEEFKKGWDELDHEA